MKMPDLKLLLILPLLLSACSLNNSGDTEMHAVTDINYKLVDTVEVLVTSESGDKIALKENVAFREGYAQGNLIVIQA